MLDDNLPSVVAQVFQTSLERNARHSENDRILVPQLMLQPSKLYHEMLFKHQFMRYPPTHLAIRRPFMLIAALVLPASHSPPSRLIIPQTEFALWGSQALVV